MISPVFKVLSERFLSSLLEKLLLFLPDWGKIPVINVVYRREIRVELIFCYVIIPVNEENEIIFLLNF